VLRKGALVHPNATVDTAHENEGAKIAGESAMTNHLKCAECGCIIDSLTALQIGVRDKGVWYHAECYAVYKAKQLKRLIGT
jgi:hypothetical protein